MHDARAHTMSSDKLAGIKIRFVSSICLSLFFVYCYVGWACECLCPSCSWLSSLCMWCFMRRAQTISRQRFTFTFHRHCCDKGATGDVVWVASRLDLRVATAMTPTRQLRVWIIHPKGNWLKAISNAILVMLSVSSHRRSVVCVREVTRSTRSSFMPSRILARWRQLENSCAANTR